jgi:hypothetical protein
VGVLVIPILIGALLLLSGLHCWRIVRRIESLTLTPCAAVRGGLVQVQGKAVGGNPFPSLIFGIPCYCSLVRVSPRGRRRGREEKRVASFKVQDESGSSVLVDPTGADLDLAPDVEITVHDHDVVSLEGHGDAEEARRRLAGYWPWDRDSLRAVERNLCRNDPVLVIGTAVEESSGMLVVRKAKGAPLVVAEGGRDAALGRYRRGMRRGLAWGSLLVLGSVGFVLASR